MASVTFNVLIHEEDNGSYWAEVEELRGCFASGSSIEELQEATFEAIQMWLPDGIELGKPTWSDVEDAPPRRRPPKAKSRSRRQPRRALVHG
jgi:predicted RNase H-like HicB family nuclease